MRNTPHFLEFIHGEPNGQGPMAGTFQELVMAFTLSGSLAIDESSGTQNQTDGGSDSTGNDVAGGLGTLITAVPQFDALLEQVVGPNVEPTNVAVSNATADNSTGASLLTNLGDNVTNISFTNAAGTALTGDDSHLTTTDGTKVYLYSYSGADLPGVDENNVVFGRKAFADGTADPNGDIVFAAYLQPTGAGDVALTSDSGASGAKVWLVEYESLFHNDATNNDDSVSPLDVLYVTISQNSEFSLEGAPSGQNLFLMYGTPGDGNAANGDEVALVVTAKDAATGGSVNTGQGGGGTTIGSNNQMIDPGEGMTFTFVTNAVSDFTVPNLTQTEADVEANIQFGGVISSDTASFKVVQNQPSSKASTVQIKALLTAAESGVGYVAGLANDSQVNVTSVVIKNAAGTVIETYGDTDNDGLTITITNGIATIVGVKAGYHIEYTAVGHNRVEISNTGVANTKTGADFDIGDFSIPRPITTTAPFNALVFQDDGPVLAAAVVTSEVDEDGLTNGNPGGVGDLNAADNINDDGGSEADTSGNISGLFVGGADGLASFGLSDDPLDIAGLPTGLTSKGDAVSYSVLANKLTASAGGREIFTLEITNTVTGAYVFTLKDQLDHPDATTEDNLNLELGSILQVTDGDGDTATATAGQLVITVNDDSPDEMTPAGIEVDNLAGATSDAALGSFDKVGSDDDGTAAFVGTDGSILTGDLLGNGVTAPEALLFGGSNIYLYGFGTDTLTATTNSIDPTLQSDWVFQMTLNPSATQASDRYDITMFKAIANTQDVDFGNFVAKVASGNPAFKMVENIGGSTIDALFNAYQNLNTVDTVNIATVGVSVGNGQDFSNGDRMVIQFLEDDGGTNNIVTAAEARTINRFTYIMNQNNPGHQDGDLTVRAFNAAGTEVKITGILINGTALVAGGNDLGSVPSHDAEGPVVADANGLGWDLHGLGGGLGNQSADNDSVTIITANGYQRIEITGTGTDANKDTFDILLKSVAIPVAYDATFTVQADLTDYDGDTSDAVDLAVLIGVPTP